MSADRARPAGPETKGQPPQVAHVVIPSSPLAVREALRNLLDTLVLRSLPDDGRSSAELVLSEALNNIVEHAYADSTGAIEVTLSLSSGGLDCQIVDAGRPMPEEALPQGTLPVLTSGAGLPEGGFGWFLIRALSQDLRYARVDGRNLLTFRLTAGQFPKAEATVSNR